jgi:hypothetical protein
MHRWTATEKAEVLRLRQPGLAGRTSTSGSVSRSRAARCATRGTSGAWRTRYHRVPGAAPVTGRDRGRSATSRTAALPRPPRSPSTSRRRRCAPPRRARVCLDLDQGASRRNVPLLAQPGDPARLTAPDGQPPRCA